MLSSVTLDDASGNPVTIHLDTTTSKRGLTSADGLVGIGSLRDSKRARPTGHGGLNETRWEDGKSIVLNGEIMSQSSVGDAIAEFRLVTAPMLATLDSGPALLKWQEGIPDIPAVPAQTKFVDAATPLSPSLYWRHGETVGSTANDLSGNGRTGTYGAGITINQTGLVGDGDRAITGDGSANAKVTSSYNPFTGNLTVCGWANATTLAAARNVFGGSAASGPLLQIQTTGDVTWWSDLTAATQTWATAWTAAAPIFWALTWNNSTKVSELFLNAVSKGTKTSVNAFNATPGNFILAGSNAASGFLGPMDETLVFAGTILSSAQIAALYADGPVAATSAGTSGTIGGLALQRLVKLDGDVSPSLQEAAATLNYQAAFYAEDPRAYSQTLTTVNSSTLSTSAAGMVLPATLNFTLGAASGGVATCTNAGNRPTPPIFRLVGGLTNPVITRLSNQAKLSLVGTIGAGDYLELDVAKRTVKLNGSSNATNLLDSANSDWASMEAPVGAETFTLRAASNDSTAALTVFFRSAYA